MLIKLKPCPFCNGGRASIKQADKYFVAVCGNCLASGPMLETISAAADGWNHRSREIEWHLTEDELPNKNPYGVGDIKLVTTRNKKGDIDWNRAYCDKDGDWHGSGSMSGVVAWANIVPYYPSLIGEAEDSQ